MSSNMVSHSNCGSDKYFDEHTRICHPCSDCKPPRPQLKVCQQQCAGVLNICSTDYYYDGFLGECRSCTECLPPRPTNQYCSSCPYLSSSTPVSSNVTNTTSNPSVKGAVVGAIVIGIMLVILILAVALYICYWRQQRANRGRDDRKANGTTIEMNEVDSLVPNRNDQVGDNGTLIYQPSSGRPDGIALESQSHSPYLPVLCPTGGRLYTPPSSPITQPNDGGGDRSIMCPTSARLNGNHSEALVPSNVICTSAFTATGENLARSGGNVANENEIRDTDSSGYSITARVPLEVGGVEQQPV